MEYGSFIAAAIGFAPAIALMLWTLQDYTYPRIERPYFSDPTLFGLFAAGIIIGVILHAVSVFFSFEYLVIGFLLEEAVKLLILNLPRFQRRADVPFYGFGLARVWPAPSHWRREYCSDQELSGCAQSHHPHHILHHAILAAHFHRNDHWHRGSSWTPFRFL